MTEDRFQWLKKHYSDIEGLAYCGMVFWFVPAVLGFGSLNHSPNLVYNPLLDYFLIMMFVIHLVLVSVCFDDSRLWRWIN